MSTYTTLIDPISLSQKYAAPNWVIIDCRFGLGDKEQGRKDHQHSHIPGAIYVHLDEDLSGEIIPGTTGRHPLPPIKDCEERFSNWGIGADTQVIVYDYSHGGIAARLWWMLNWLGHEKVAVLNGGWTAWQAAGLPVDNSISKPQAQTFIANSQPDWVVDAETISDLDPQKTCLVDARAAQRYRGEKEPIDPIAGHIPGAVNYPFADNLDETGQWKSKEALRERFAPLLEGRDSSELIFYCGSGVTACHDLLALKHAGFGNARLFPGSWSGWITDASRPIAKQE